MSLERYQKFIFRRVISLRLYFLIEEMQNRNRLFQQSVEEVNKYILSECKKGKYRCILSYNSILMLRFLSMRVFLYCAFFLIVTFKFANKQNYFMIYVFLWIIWMFENYLIHFKKINKKASSWWLNYLWIVLVIFTFIAIQLYLELYLLS